MLKIGIIGCGKITQVRHAPEYAESSQCQLVAWYDALPERAKAMAQEFGGTAYDSVEALLASGVDAVSVCTANADHARVAIAALEAGCHVLCEKPMATTLADCLAMKEAAQASGKRLLIGHNQRLAKAHVEARRLIESGAIGRIVGFHTMFGHPGPEGWTGQRNSWFFDKKRAAFGVMADLGVHKTDLLHYLLGEPIVEVSAMLATVDKTYPDGTPIAVDDNALCIYRTQSGAIGQLHVSWTNYGVEDNSTRIYGTEGVLRLYDDPECSLILEKRDGTVQRFKLDLLTSNKEQTSGGRTSTGVIDTFVEAITAGTPSPLDVDEAIKAMRVIFAAEQSAQRGASVRVEYD